MKSVTMITQFRLTALTTIAIIMVFTAWGFCMAGSTEKAPLADMAISDAVADELRVDRAVPEAKIEVLTTEGIVSLSGTVTNILAKERAEALAETVKGVRAVVNKIRVVPPVVRTDAALLKDIKNALLADPATDSFEIGVIVRDNIVTLSGSVDSWQERSLAEKVAKGVKGVVHVENDISVDYKQKRPDFEIKADIEQSLHWNTLVDDALISVNVQDGKVRLSGTVGSASERSEAIINAWVMGVKDVDASDLVVEKWARDKDLRKDKYVVKSDDEIREAVKDTLFYDPRVMSFNITPEVHGATVTLRGTVDNLQAKMAAERDAKHTVGVISVINRIKVRPDEPLADKDVAQAVRAALLRDPYVESYEVTVSVQNGVADLYGTVDSYFEKLQAEDVASRVPGVVLVDNNIHVDEDYAPYVYDPYVDKWDPYDYEWYDYRPGYTASSDWEIELEIEDELYWSPFVDAGDVNVSVENGVAELTGTVDSWSEYRAAAENAYEGGAEWVDNDLVVKTWKR
jgi:osmotically-inducible protein OsmY